jgi:hypothetical protein
MDSVLRLFEALAVKIWLWNLAHRLMRPNEAPGFFWGQDLFWWLQRNLVACLLWATGKTDKAKSLQVALLIQYRTSKFYSAWLVSRLSLNFYFSRKSRDYTISLMANQRYFIDFKKINETYKYKSSFIEFYRFFINLASEVTRLAHPWFK